MGQIKVRQLDDWIVSVLQDMAKESGQSLEQHLRIILREMALESQREFGREQAKQLQEFKKEFGTLQDSVEGIRKERWESS